MQEQSMCVLVLKCLKWFLPLLELDKSLDKSHKATVTQEVFLHVRWEVWRSWENQLVLS